jgi:NAD(P) transhydrogenase
LNGNPEKIASGLRTGNHPALDKFGRADEHHWALDGPWAEKRYGGLKREHCMSNHHYDVVVIGTGPGGEGAAMQATKLGKSVAAVEEMSMIGGNCTHRGTIPSKALRFAIYQAANLHNLGIVDSNTLAQARSFPNLRKSAASVIAKQVGMRRSFYERNDVPVYHGHAKFPSPNTIDVLDDLGGRRKIQGEAIIIATGSRPHRRPEIDFTHPSIFDSDTILDLPETPRSISIYGAGVVGCEYASMFRNLGVKVNLVNTRDKILEFLDDEIIDSLSYHLREQVVFIRLRVNFDHIEPVDDGVVLHF